MLLGLIFLNVKFWARSHLVPSVFAVMSQPSTKLDACDTLWLLETHIAFVSLQPRLSAIVLHFLLSLSWLHLFQLGFFLLQFASELLNSIRLIKKFFHNLVSSAVGLVLVFIVSPGFLFFRLFQKYGTNSDLLITHGAAGLSNLCTFFFQKILFYFLKCACKSINVNHLE